MLFFSNGFINELRQVRTCYIGGDVGTGKTLIALEIAEIFLRKGWFLVSNMSCVWNDDYYQKEIPLNKNVFGIIDEGGNYTRTMDTVAGFTEFSRKARQIVLFVGHREPHELLTYFVLYPWWDLKKNLLLPLKIWRWDVYQRRKNFSGFVFQTGWEKYYGLYSSIDPGAFPSEIFGFFEKRKKDLFDAYGRKYSISDVVRGSTGRGKIASENSPVAVDLMAEKIRASISASKRKSAGRFRR